jgi:hypothetical protein
MVRLYTSASHRETASQYILVMYSMLDLAGGETFHKWLINHDENCIYIYSSMHDMNNAM